MFPNSQAHLLKEAHPLPSEISYSVILYKTHVDEIQVGMNHWRNLKWNGEITVVIQGAGDIVTFTPIPAPVTGGLSLFPDNWLHLLSLKLDVLH